MVAGTKVCSFIVAEAGLAGFMVKSAGGGVLVLKACTSLRLLFLPEEIRTTVHYSANPQLLMKLSTWAVKHSSFILLRRENLS